MAQVGDVYEVPRDNSISVLVQLVNQHSVSNANNTFRPGDMGFVQAGSFLECRGKDERQGRVLVCLTSAPRGRDGNYVATALPPGSLFFMQEEQFDALEGLADAWRKAVVADQSVAEALVSEWASWLRNKKSAHESV